MLREWFHWWHDNQTSDNEPPELLHVRTAAYLAARAASEGLRRLHGPHDL